MYPEAFGAGTTPEEGPKSGFMPALKAGFSNLKGDVAALAGRTGLMALPEAEKYIAEQEAYQKKTYAPTAQGWTEAPLTKIGELAGGSIPYMAAPLVAGGALAAGAALAPEAALATGLGALTAEGGVGLSALGAGLSTAATAATSAGQFTGSNLSRQMQEGKKLGETDVTAAALAAIPQAALDTVSLHMIPGIGKMFEKVGVDLSEKAAKDLAKEGLKKTAADYLLSTGKTMGIEGLTEAGQQVFERMQAGLSITDPSARAEYFDNFLGGAVLGGILAPAGRYVERGQEQARFDKGAREKQAADRIAATQASEQAAAEEEAKKQTPEYAQQAQAAYLAAEQRKTELEAQLHRASKGNKLTEDQKQDNKETQQALAEHADVLKEANREFRKYRQFLPAEPAPTPAKIENTTQLQQPEMFGAPAAPKAPELDMFGKPVERAANTAEALANEQQRSLYGPDSRQAQLQQTFDMYDQTVGNRGVVDGRRVNAAETLPNQNDPRQQVRMLEQLVQQYQSQLGDASPQEIVALAPKYEQAKAALDQSRKAVEALPKPIEDQLAKLHQRLGVAKEKGDVTAAAKLSQSILNLQQQAVPTAQQSIELQPFKGTSQTAEQIEQEKAAALEAQRQKAQQDAKAESDAYVAQRIQERRTQRKLNEANAPAAAQPQRDEELRHRAEKETIDKLVATLPTGSTVTPGQIMLGLGGEKAHLRDLQTQLAIAKLTRNKALINSLNDQIADIKASQENAATNKPVERLPALGEGKLPESRAKEAEAEQHADRQSELLQAFVAQLQKLKLRPDTAKVAARLQDINKKREAAGKPAITLADQSSTLLDTARMAYLKSHLDEIESRRAAFGLPPMADWEIGEARARVMEGFNELQDRWGQAVPENAPAGKRQFGAPTAAVAALQDQMRTNIYQNVSSAAERMMKNTEGTMKEKTAQRSATPTFERDENGQLRQTGYARQTGPQPITPNLNLREQPKLAEDDKQNTLDMIDQVLNTLETRTTAKPTETVKPPAKVKSLSDIAQLLAEEKSGTTTAKTDASSVELLHQLRDALEKTSDKEFIALAREQVQRIMEGNLPDQFAVRELGDMIRAQEEGRQSATRPGATQEELQRTSAQPQRSLFPEGEPVTQRATPENFQKMLDSKNVQGMREALAQQKTDNQAALQAVKDSLQPAKTAAQQAEAALNKAKQKAAPLLASAEKERGEPEWYAPAARKVVELETALQSIPPRIALLTDIREKIANLDADQKNTLIRQVKQTLAIADKKPFERSQELLKLQEKYKKAKYYSTNPNPRLIKNISENLALVKENIDTTYSPKEITELLELQNALTDSSLLTKEIDRLTAAVRLAESTITKARADLNKLLEQHVADTTVRESLLAEANKATAKIEKLTKAFEEAKRQETTEQSKPVEEKPVSEATPMATWRAALQRGREGMDLPGTRVTQDVAELKQRVLGIRRKLGSFDAQLETLQDPNRKLAKGDKEKIADLKKKRSDAVVELDSVYENAPRVTTEIKEQGQLDLEKAFDEAQAAGYDLMARKRQEKAGELPPELPAAKKGSTVVDIRTGRVSESGVRNTPAARAKIAERALRQLAITRAELKALQDRMQYLRDNDKAKKGNRYTELFKELQAKEAALKETVAQKQAVVAEVTKSQKETNAAVASARKSVEEAQSGKDALALKEAEEQRQAEASGPVVFRTQTRTGAGLKEQQVARLADRITATWTTTPEIIVVATEKGLPAHIQEQARLDNMTGKIPGLYDTQTKKVYLVAENLHTGEDVALTIAHEIAGHFGLREMMGSSYKTEMNRIYDGSSNVRKEADAKMAANKRLSRETAVEEVLAELAEKGEPSTLRRIYNIIKHKLAQFFGLKRVTDQDVQQVVANARRYVQEGVGGMGGEAPVEGVNYRTADYKSEDALSKLAKRVVATPKTLRERAGTNIALQAEMQVADMRAGVIKALNNAVEDPNTMGSTKLFRQAVFSITAADQHGAVTQMALSNGPPVMHKDAKGYYEVRSSMKDDAGAVFDAVQDIPDSYGNTEAKMGVASMYMIAQRAMNKGLKKLDLGAMGVTEQELADVMSAVNADPKLRAALENARTKYNAYNRGMIEWLASPQVGAISQADAKAYLKDEDYVPYYRVRADGVAELVFGGEKTITIGDISHQPYLAELKGGEDKIMPLDKSIMRNTMLLVTKGMNNTAMKNVAYAMQAAGQGLGPVDKNGKPTNLMPIHAGKGPADASVIRWTQEPDPNRPDDKGERWLRVQTNDTIFGGVPAELIIKSLEGAHLTLPAFLKWGGVAGDLLRSGVTRTPIYLAKQLFRDPFAATATSGLDYGPMTAIFKANKEFLKIATGKSEAGAKMIEKGLIQSGLFEGDPANMSKIALQLASGKSQGVFDKLFAKADQLALQADAATRALIYDNAIKNGLSEVEASHAVRESMNFSKRGLSPTVQYASRMIPFFNAQIQGLSVLFKAATGNMPANDVLKIKRKFFNNAMMLTGFGIAYAMAMDDDDYYKNAKPKDRYSNFFVPLPGVDEPLKLPIPYEFGFFFSAGVAAVDAIKGEVDTPQQLRAIKDMFVGAIPGASNDFVVPQIIKPIAEVYANKNFYSGNPLVSARLEKLDPEAQYNANTTEFAKFMAKMVPGLSPIQIEHIVSGYLGQIPLMIAATTNDMFREGKAEPTRKMSDLPLIGSSFQRKYGGEDADVVYKLATDAAAAKRTFDNYRKTGKIEDAKAYLQEHRAEITVAPMALQYQKIMGALRTQEEIIRGSNMPPDAKAKRIDDLDKQRQLQSERYLKAIRRAEEASGRT